MEYQEINLYTIASPPQSLDSGLGYFPQAPGITLADGTILYTWRDDAIGSSATGTGTFDPFLTLQTIKTTESGTNFYSNGTYGTGDSVSAAGSRTSSIETSSIPVIEFGGIEYYEIRLDVNEVSGAKKGFIDLNTFNIYGSNSSTQGSTGANLLYSLDTADLDTTIHIFDDDSGSGKSDVVMLIPKSHFSSNPEYLYFEASLSNTDGGFEEFSVRVLEPENPLLTITKVASVDAVDSASDVIDYTITVENAGNVTLTGIVLTDEFATATLFSGDADSDSQLDVGESWIYKASHTVSQAEMDAGKNLVNLAIADTDQTDAFQDDAITQITQNPLLKITKIASVDAVDSASDVIDYTITVENAGNVTLTGIVLTDEFATATLFSGDADSDSQLDVGESWIYKASHTVSQAEMDAGKNLVNLAIADTDQTDAFQDDAITQITQNPLLKITKIASVDAVDSASDVIDYTITVENAGNVTLTGIVLTDEFATATLFSGDADSDSQLDVGESWIYKASHTVSQAEMDAGKNLVNLAIADTDQTDAFQDDAITQITQNPLLKITKIASVDAVDSASDVIDYTITVENAGNVTLTGIVLTDEFATATLFSGDADSDSQLDVGESWIYKASHTVSQAEMDAGKNLVNLAIADTDQTDAFQDDAITQITQNPLLKITKIASVDAVDSASDVIDYTITVENAGNVTLTGIVLTDEFATATLFSGDADSDSQLDVGESWIYKASHTVSQAEMDAGKNLVNLAIADTDQTDAFQDDAITQITQNPLLKITKIASVDAVDSASDVIDYTITVENAGNVTLTGIVLTDEFATATLFSGDADSDSQLDVGESWIYKASHTVSQAEMDAGKNLVNLAIADTDQTDAFQDDAITQITQNPLLKITKIASVDAVDSASDVIDYTITVENAGNVTLTGIVLTDEFATATLFSGDADSDSQLDVGESWIYKASHTVSQAEMDAGKNLVNLAIADTDQTDAFQDDAITQITQNPLLKITKIASVDAVDSASDVIDYTITVENAGNVTLTGIVLTDEFATATLFSGDADSDSQLDVGESWIYKASHTVSQAEMDAGKNLVNLAIADTDQTDAFQDDAITQITQNPLLKITKIASVDAVDSASDVIDYTITVENAGNVTLTGIVLTDEFATATLFSGDADSDSQLDVGESWIYKASHTVSQAEMDAGKNLVNLAIADTDQTDAFQDDAITQITQNPLLKITKIASVDAVDSASDVIDYTITVENAGNVTLTGIVLTDEFATATLFSGDADSDSQLDVGESWIYKASHTVSQAEMDAGKNLVNLAIADTDQTDAFQDDAVTSIEQNPDLHITKTANVDFVDAVGDSILYTITVANEGNITLNGVTVTDAMLAGSLTNDSNKDGAIDGDVNNNSALDLGETWVWTGQYIVTQADIDAARATNDPYMINNTAYADSNQTGVEEASENVGVKVDFEGLSHGYWKQHPSDWDGLTTGTSFENFFFGSQQSSLKWLVKTSNPGKVDKFSTVNDITFDQALALTGGDQAALAREAVAAVLNFRDEDVTYRFTESQIKEWVGEALTNQAVDINHDGINEFAAGAAAITGVKNLLELNNNLELV